GGEKGKGEGKGKGKQKQKQKAPPWRGRRPERAAAASEEKKEEKKEEEKKKKKKKARGEKREKPAGAAAAAAAGAAAAAAAGPSASSFASFPPQLLPFLSLLSSGVPVLKLRGCAGGGGGGGGGGRRRDVWDRRVLGLCEVGGGGGGVVVVAQESVARCGAALDGGVKGPSALSSAARPLPHPNSPHRELALAWSKGGRKGRNVAGKGGGVRPPWGRRPQEGPEAKGKVMFGAISEVTVRVDDDDDDDDDGASPVVTLLVSTCPLGPSSSSSLCPGRSYAFRSPHPGSDHAARAAFARTAKLLAYGCNLLARTVGGFVVNLPPPTLKDVVSGIPDGMFDLSRGGGGGGARAFVRPRGSEETSRAKEGQFLKVFHAMMRGRGLGVLRLDEGTGGYVGARLRFSGEVQQVLPGEGGGEEGGGGGEEDGYGYFPIGILWEEEEEEGEEGEGEGEGNDYPHPPPPTRSNDDELLDSDGSSSQTPPSPAPPPPPPPPSLSRSLGGLGASSSDDDDGPSSSSSRPGALFASVTSVREVAGLLPVEPNHHRHHHHHPDYEGGRTILIGVRDDELKTVNDVRFLTGGTEEAMEFVDMFLAVANTVLGMVGRFNSWGIE
ncbi:hypothetical protein ScalyP_jg3969, partial [Parmales sp. scaly parma]